MLAYASKVPVWIFHVWLAVKKKLCFKNLPISGRKLRVCNENLIFLFLNQNICFGYSK